VFQFPVSATTCVRVLSVGDTKRTPGTVSAIADDSLPSGDLINCCAQRSWARFNFTWVSSTSTRAIRIGLQTEERGAGLLDLRLKQGRIQFGDDLALANLGVEVRVQRLDGAGYLASDLDRRDGLQCSGCGDVLHDRATGHGDESVRLMSIGAVTRNNREPQPLRSPQ
jgi:hypothetical protein